MTENDDLPLLSASKLAEKLEHGFDPDFIYNKFLRIRLVHLWANLGQIEHLKVLLAAGADFSQRTRYGTTVHDEVISNWKKNKSLIYLECIEWLERNVPQFPKSASILASHDSIVINTNFCQDESSESLDYSHSEENGEIFDFESVLK